MAFKWVRFIFGQSGDRTAIPGPVDVSGNVSYEQGYGPDYQRPKTDPLSKNIERDKMNSLFYDLSGNIQTWQLQALPDWVPAVDNGGVAVSYPIGAKVRYAVDGNFYRSTKAANVSTPGANTDWILMQGALIARRVFSTTQVYTPTPGTAFVDVTVVGGGGGGGGAVSPAASQVAAGVGGGGGGWAKKRITTAFAGVTITVGAGGPGGVGTAGTAGGSTSFGALVSATGGGAGGLGASSAANNSFNGQSNGGIGSSGDYNALGGIGMYGIYATAPISGKGGGSFCGEGAVWVVGGYVSGNAASVPGSGGSGSASGIPGSGVSTGGSGREGLCIVEEYGFV